MKLFSYIDPGTGSMFLQVILGAILGGFVVFRRFFSNVAAKVMGLFGRRRAVQEQDESK